MNNILFDFTKGLTAKLLERERGLVIDVPSIEKKLLNYGTDFSTSNIQIGPTGFFISPHKEEQIFLFAYKKNVYKLGYDGEKITSPKFHIFECTKLKESRKDYFFADKMPVEIYSRSDNQFDSATLRLCEYCRKLSTQSLFSFDPESPWYEAILKRAAEEVAPVYRNSDGYLISWNQVSHAYRTSKGYTCEECNLNFSDKELSRWLHTHHRDGDKKHNHPNNFKALCQFCHAWEHRNSPQLKKMASETKRFIELFRRSIPPDKLSILEQL